MADNNDGNDNFRLLDFEDSESRDRVYYGREQVEAHQKEKAARRAAIEQEVNKIYNENRDIQTGTARRSRLSISRYDQLKQLIRQEQTSEARKNITNQISLFNSVVRNNSSGRGQFGLGRQIETTEAVQNTSSSSSSSSSHNNREIIISNKEEKIKQLQESLEVKKVKLTEKIIEHSDIAAQQAVAIAALETPVVTKTLNRKRTQVGNLDRSKKRRLVTIGKKLQELQSITAEISRLEVRLEQDN